MNSTHFQLSIRIDPPLSGTLVLESVSSDITAGELVRRVLALFGSVEQEQHWHLTYRGSSLPASERLGVSLPSTGDQLVLQLSRISWMDQDYDLENQDDDLENQDDDLASWLDEEAASAGDTRGASALPAPTTEEDVFAWDSSKDDSGTVAEHRTLPHRVESNDVTKGVEPHGQRRVRSRLRNIVARRATVRHYSRMTPERVYPLLIMITKDMVEKVLKKDTDQRSSRPFEVDADSPVEIEPVLPGCTCYPSKIVARLDGGELTATFRVVPHVLGVVDGATVTIRQDHALLAEIPLDVKVAKRTWVAVSGTMTFVLPGASAIMKHFGLDFTTQKEEGFNLYLTAARAIFDWASPLGLTAGLGLTTGLLWWLTRPRTRDVFWDIEKVGPTEKLKRIAAAMESNPEQASADLLELLKAFPENQPVRLFYSEWHFATGNYEAALKGYERALKLGVAKSRHYNKASISASRLGDNRTALQILQEAERVLPAGKLPGVLLYNMGCYQARLGDLDQAMTSLKRAVDAGYKKAESYQEDPDLAPLQSRRDFQQLLARVTGG